MKVLLQGVEALVWRLKQNIPISARPYFMGLKDDMNVDDLPTGFMLPPLRDLQRLANGIGGDERDAALEISQLVAKWSAMTIDG